MNLGPPAATSNYLLSGSLFFQMCTPAQPAWPGFAMGHIMKTLNLVNSSLVQAPMEEKVKLTHKLEDNLYCAKVIQISEQC